MVDSNGIDAFVPFLEKVPFHIQNTQPHYITHFEALQLHLRSTKHFFVFVKKILNELLGMKIFNFENLLLNFYEAMCLLIRIKYNFKSLKTTKVVYNFQEVYCHTCKQYCPRYPPFQTL